MSNSQLNHTEDDKPNNKALFWIVLGITIGLAVTCVWSVHLYNTTLSDQLDYVQNNAIKSYKLQKYELVGMEELSQFKWVNKAQNKMQIPIDLAMEIVADDYANSNTSR